MGVNVNYFKQFSEYLSNKSQAGATISPSQFNQVANQAQLQLFENDFETFLQSGSVSEYLKTFLKNKTTSVPVDGTLPYPSDFQHASSIRSYFVRPGQLSTEIPVVEVKNTSWGNISTSQLQQPTKRFPKYSEFGDGIRFLPKLIGTVMLDYFKTPTPPVWGYTKIANQPVYNSATSTNFDWSEFSLNEIMGIYLTMIGINIKDGDLAQWSQQFKQENKSLL